MSFALSGSRGSKSTAEKDVGRRSGRNNTPKAAKNTYSWGEKASDEGVSLKFFHKLIRLFIGKVLPGIILVIVCLHFLGDEEEGKTSAVASMAEEGQMTTNDIVDATKRVKQDEDCTRAVDKAYEEALSGDPNGLEKRLKAAVRDIEDTCAGEIRKALKRADLDSVNMRGGSMITSADGGGTSDGELDIQGEQLAGPDIEEAALKDCKYCPRLVFIPPGQASFPDQPLRYVSHSFFVTRSEVTWQNYQAFVDETGYKSERKCFTLEKKKWKLRKKRDYANPATELSPNRPVTCVSYNDANAFAVWLGQKTGKRYRLPTQHEWARMAFLSQDLNQSEQIETSCAGWNAADIQFQVLEVEANVSDCDDGYLQTAPANTFIDRAGLSNLAGNVWEWAAGYRHSDEEEEPRQFIMGGSWATPLETMAPNVVRVTAETTRSSLIGFRLVRDQASRELFEQENNMEQAEGTTNSNVFRGRS